MNRPDRQEVLGSALINYITACDLLISCHFRDPRSPVLFKKEDMKFDDFRISVIADITCDINGSIPSTIKASDIEHPFYGYNPKTEQVDV